MGEMEMAVLAVQVAEARGVVQRLRGALEGLPRDGSVSDPLLAELERYETAASCLACDVTQIIYGATEWVI